MAIDGLAVLHVPPLTLLIRFVVAPAHTLIVPVMAGSPTVKDLVADVLPHALLTVYEMTALPASTPLTTPVLLTVATELAEDDHTPPLILSAKLMVPPTATDEGPVMIPADGVEFTVIAAIREQPVLAIV